MTSHLTKVILAIGLGVWLTPGGQGQQTRRVRLNKIIELFEQGKPAFGGFVSNGNIAAAQQAGNSNWDFALIEMEHTGFGFFELRRSLQYMLNRKRIFDSHNLQAVPTPLVRIPANGRELNEWMVKQTMDYGAYGLLFPHINTVEDALHAVQSIRYPQKKGVPDFGPEGRRGTSAGVAQTYWGIPNFEEYHRLADTWPLDPNGEVLVVILIEEEQGLTNVREILRQVKGIGCVVAAEVDLSTSMGFPGQPNAPGVQQAVATIEAAAKEFRVPIGSLANRNNIADRVQRGFQLLVTSDPAAIETGRRAAGR